MHSVAHAQAGYGKLRVGTGEEATGTSSSGKTVRFLSIILIKSPSIIVITLIHTFFYPIPALTDGTQHVACPLLAVIHFLTEISP